MASGWEHRPGRHVRFPDSWPESLRSVYRRLMDECAQVRVTDGEGVFPRCYLTSFGDGAPAVSRNMYDGYVSDVFVISMPTSIEPLHAGRDGLRTPHWSFDRDEPVLWVLSQ